MQVRGKKVKYMKIYRKIGNGEMRKKTGMRIADIIGYSLWRRTIKNTTI